MMKMDLLKTHNVSFDLRRENYVILTQTFNRHILFGIDGDTLQKWYGIGLADIDLKLTRGRQALVVRRVR